MKPTARNKLEQFYKNHGINSVGRLSMVLLLSRKAKNEGLPLKIMVTEGGGQISGLGGSKLGKILAEYGITRKLSSEAGRTSRGSISLGPSYVDLINLLFSQGELGKGKDQIAASLNEIEQFCVGRIQFFFDSEKIKIDLDSSMSISQFISKVIDEATERQQRLPGSTVLGTVLQHMVGAKLSLSFPEIQIEHHPASACDKSTARLGDFVMGETALHVTAFPAPLLLEKCQQNLSSGMRPVIICPFETVTAAARLAKTLGIGDRVEIYPAEQFISMNLNELGKFKSGNIRIRLNEFIEKYNEIITACETDPSLQFERK